MPTSDDPRPAMKRRRLRLRKPTWRGWFTIGLIVIVIGLVTAWAVDYGSLGDRVARNVTIENVDVGRTTGAGLDQALEKADAEYGKGTVEFVIDGRSYPMSAAEIGLHLDTGATSRSARQVARHDPAPLRPLYWLTSWFTPRRVPVTVSLDRTKLTRALAGLPGQTPVTEPKVVGSVDAIGTSPGATGNGFEPDRVAGQIERVARDGTLPLRVPLVDETIQPVVSDDEIELLAAQARTLTDRSVDLTIPGKSMTATPAMLRSWISSILPEGARHAKLALDADLVLPALRQQLGSVVTRPVAATFTVEGSRVLLVPQVDGLSCCSAASGDAILEALDTDAPGVDLPLVKVPPEFTTARARALGITTLLGAGLPSQTQVLWKPGAPKAPPAPDEQSTSTSTTSTTSTTTTTVPTPTDSGVGTGQFVVPIPGRQGQLTNVERALPLLSGRIIMPGAELSLSEVIGPPSPDRRFVRADVATADGPTWISGGGTDLIAAALFEAAYESGLDIPSSTRHGVLPDGVRPGIEATLGWTQPDLVIANPSKH
ncbi:MAG TPA: VanW family protein, partial [Acidimicrobiales bacterium]|nr:VanW family protein [Acidimicrobiales bacterium]